MLNLKCTYTGANINKINLLDKFMEEKFKKIAKTLNNDYTKSFNESVILLKKQLFKLSINPNYTLVDNILEVSILEKIVQPNIVYKIKYAICQGCFGNLHLIVLCVDKNKKVRFFTLENGGRLALCEYTAINHINYGQIEYKELAVKINSILS